MWSLSCEDHVWELKLFSLERRKILELFIKVFKFIKNINYPGPECIVPSLLDGIRPGDTVSNYRSRVPNYSCANISSLRGMWMSGMGCQVK